MATNHPDGSSQPYPASITDDSYPPPLSLLVRECQLKRKRTVEELCPELEFSVVDTANSIALRNEPVTPVLHVSIEKGIFMSHDRKWSLYRRGDFVVRSNFAIDGCTQENYTPGDFHIGSQAVTGFKLRMRAETGNARPIELLQTTRHRNKNLIQQVAGVPVVPRGAGETAAEALWERVQFKSANSWINDGPHGYFHLIIELLAETAEEADAVCVAQVKSGPLVVRGADPSKRSKRSRTASKPATGAGTFRPGEDDRFMLESCGVAKKAKI
jgi:hypothetical protein